jgi:DNA invertase Pin-like site-specific DNA recombinase
MMTALVGYARCSTHGQDLAIQKAQLASLGVPEDRVYLDQGFSGTKRARPGLDQALAAVREGDTLVVTALDRLARSVPDAHEVLSQLSARGVKFQEGGKVYDWSTPVDRMYLQVLAIVAEFQANLIRQRTRDGMAIARAKGKLRGRQPKLSPTQQSKLVRLYQQGEDTIPQLAEIFKVSRPTVYRVLARSATDAGSSQAGPTDRRPSRSPRVAVPGQLPEPKPTTGPEVPPPLPARFSPLDPPQVDPAVSRDAPVTRDAPEGWLDDLADSLEEQDSAAAYVEELGKIERS